MANQQRDSCPESKLADQKRTVDAITGCRKLTPNIHASHDLNRLGALPSMTWGSSHLNIEYPEVCSRNISIEALIEGGQGVKTITTTKPAHAFDAGRALTHRAGSSFSGCGREEECWVRSTVSARGVNAARTSLPTGSMNGRRRTCAVARHGGALPPQRDCGY
jgi:hypothetical protein